MQRILVLGGGFAGLWSAVGAARKLDELGIGPAEVDVTLVSSSPWHSIRVRNYEAELDGTRIPLDDVLRPIGVRRVEAEVADLHFDRREIACSGRSEPLRYDRLVFALGSQLARPPIPGLAVHAFDVDTYDAASRLNRHIVNLPRRKASAGRNTVLVVGGGLTGIEAATEMPAKLAAAFAGEKDASWRVILADHKPWIGSDMGDEARPVIDEALRSLSIEARPGVGIAAVDEAGVTLATGERIPSETVVWCAGMQANPLTQRFPVERDRFGRLPVNADLKVAGMAAEFAAGDVAWLPIDGHRPCVMSCQHGRPMGRYAGHNAVADLLGLPTLPLVIPWYATILDLGAWGALHTEGWERHVVSTGAAAKRTKIVINQQRIYPPRSGGRAEILATGAPVLQAAPARL